MGFHGSDLRKGRVSERGRIYLVTTVTRGRACLFDDWETARVAVAELVDMDTRGADRTLAWVLMPDHLHWMVQLEDALLSDVVRRFKSQSARAVNRVRHGAGPIWQKGFHDRAMRKDEDVIAAARYLVANPLRAGLVRRIGDWPFWDAVWL